MEELNITQRSREDLEEARKIGEYLKSLVHSSGNVDSERDRIDDWIEDYKSGKIKTLDDLMNKGEYFAIEQRQGDH